MLTIIFARLLPCFPQVCLLSRLPILGEQHCTTDTVLIQSIKGRQETWTKRCRGLSFCSLIRRYIDDTWNLG